MESFAFKAARLSSVIKESFSHLSPSPDPPLADYSPIHTTVGSEYSVRTERQPPNGNSMSPRRSMGAVSVVLDKATPTKVTFNTNTSAKSTPSKRQRGLADIAGDAMTSPDPLAISSANGLVSGGEKRRRSLETRTPADGATTKKRRRRRQQQSALLGGVPMPFIPKMRPGRTAAKKARPQPAPDDRTPNPEPGFIPFLCEWRGCPAELQNLATLRAHLFKVHCKPVDGCVPCLWAKCGKIQLSGEEVPSSYTFQTREQWQNHVNRAHLIPFAWHMGDGPRGTCLTISDQSTPELATPWLFDQDGKQVTPSVADQRIELGQAKHNNARRWREALGVSAKEGGGAGGAFSDMSKNSRSRIAVVIEPVKDPDSYLRFDNYDLL